MAEIKIEHSASGSSPLPSERSVSASASCAGDTPHEEPDTRGIRQEDERLMARVTQRDATAFAQLYDRLSTPMFSLVVRIVGSRPQAEDILQEVFLLIWVRAQDYRPQLGSPFSWITSIMRHKAIDCLRARSTRYNHLDAARNHPTDHPSSPTGETCVIADESGRTVSAALIALDAGERRAIELAFFDGLTPVEIAGALDLPVGTVKTRIRGGMLKLRPRPFTLRDQAPARALVAARAIGTSR